METEPKKDIFVPLVEALSEVYPDEEGETIQKINTFLTSYLMYLKDKAGIPPKNFHVSLIGGTARQIAAPNPRYGETRSFFRNLIQVNHELLDNSENSLPVYIPETLREMTAHDIDLASIHFQPSSVSSEKFNQAVDHGLRESGWDCADLPQPYVLDTNPFIRLYDIPFSETLGVDLFTYVTVGEDCTLEGTGSSHYLDNRIGEKPTPYSQGNLPLINGKESLQIYRQHMVRVRDMLNSPDIYRHNDTLPYFDQVEAILRAMRIKSLHNPEMNVFELRSQFEVQYTLWEFISRVNQALKSDDPILNPKLALFMREILVMRHAWGDEHFARQAVGHPIYGGSLGTLVNMVAMGQRSAGSQPQRNIRTNELGSLNEQDFIQHLTGIPLKVF
ncbi:hypothetical protein KBD81_03025 [Candidatus Woesebacteria bacterium]|nr:hypothetical protein [Candidatus Woesebacteria bacterium]